MDEAIDAEVGDGLEAPALVERRASVRFACPNDAFYYSLARGRDICVGAEFHSISREGVGLLFSQEVEPGTILSVEFHSKAQEIPCFLLAQVIHASLQADGRWLVGCRFTRQLSDTELKQFC
jgi:hypothetical protein